MTLKKRTLIITSSYDKTSDYIIHKHPELNWFRFNLDEFSKYLVTYDKNGFSINFDADSILEKGCTSIYYRKPSPENLNGVFEPRYQSYAHKEAYSWIEGIIESFEGICLTKPSIMRPASNKILQAKLAEQVEFRIPTYLMTNAVCSTKNMFSKKTIIKPLAVGIIQDDENKEYVQTNIVDPTISMEALKYSPSYFQSYQPKDYEVRATFVGTEVFTVKIESKNDIDWRKRGNDISYSICQMPNSIREKCVKFMKLCNMEFGCFDFIVKNNKWFFLEMNVNGQWAWLEFETKLDISGSIARFLSGK